MTSKPNTLTHPTLSSNLSPADETFQSLMYGGAITGLCVCAGPKVVRSRMPFSTRRIENMARLIDEAFHYQNSRGRLIDRFWFGLGTFNLLAVSHQGLRIIILHVRDEETDFLAQIGLIFLKDYGNDFVLLPEHKRLVTARILVSAPDSDSVPEVPIPANPATSRIPLSPRFLEHQLSQTGPAGSGQPIIPKPIRRPVGDSDPAPGDGPPPIPPIPKDRPRPIPAGASDPWSDFRTRLHAILERALGADRADAIIKAHIEKFTGTPTNALPKAWFKDFANTVVNEITERPLHDRAKNELLALFRELSL